MRFEDFVTPRQQLVLINMIKQALKRYEQGIAGGQIEMDLEDYDQLLHFGQFLEDITAPHRSETDQGLLPMTP